MKSYRIKRKARGDLFIGLGNHSAEARDAIFNDFFLLCPRPWYSRSKRVKIDPRAGQILDRVLRLPDPRSTMIGMELGRALEAEAKIKEIWTSFTEANREGLMVEADARDPILREKRHVRLVTLTDDLDGETAPPADLTRSRAVRSLTRSKLTERMRSVEGRYERYRRTPDIEPVLPHVFRELEPYVRELQEKHGQARSEIKALLALAEVHLREEKNHAKFERDASIVPDVLAGEAARRGLSVLPNSYPREIEIEVRNEMEARAAGRRRWLG